MKHASLLDVDAHVFMYLVAKYYSERQVLGRVYDLGNACFEKRHIRTAITRWHKSDAHTAFVSINQTDRSIIQSYSNSILLLFYLSIIYFKMWA